MRALVLLLIASSAAAQVRTVKPNVYQKKKSSAYVSPYLYEKRPVDLTGDCEGTTTPTGFTFTRATSATCPKANGTIVTVSSGQPRLTSRGLLREAGATNLLLHNRDMSQAAWLKTNSACTKTATGTDGVANSASTCTASSASGTVLQGITAAAASRNSSLYIKRRTGTGTIEVTRDGATYIDITASVTAGWVRVTPLTHAGLTGSVLNPVVGIRITTSGDAVDVDRVQDEALAIATMPIDTSGTSATRNAEVISYATPVGLLTAEGCAYLCFEPEWTGTLPSTALLADAQAGAGRAWFFVQIATNIGGHQAITNPNVAAAHVAGVNKCYLLTWSATAGTWRMTNVTTSTAGTAVSYATQMTFGVTTVLGSQSGGTAGVNGYFTALRFHTTPTGCGA